MSEVSRCVIDSLQASSVYVHTEAVEPRIHSKELPHVYCTAMQIETPFIDLLLIVSTNKKRDRYRAPVVVQPYLPKGVRLLDH